ncbi:MAG: sulfatase, partial [Nitrososphaera sp.]|nr:sulfatase [Nitrososphaera sp.]
VSSHEPVNTAHAALISRPNIVVLMVDDLDESSLDIMLQHGLLPNLKRDVFDKAVAFSKSFTTYPLCCPSRSTFLTGQYTHNHGVWGNNLPDGGASKLADGSTIATWLEDSGYYTGYVGKYLNQYGVDTPQTYIPPGWSDWQATVGDSTYLMYSYTMNDNGVLVQYGNQEADYQTDVLAARSIQFISERETADSKPFFLYVNPLAPHTEDSTPPCVLNYGSLQSTLPPDRYIGTTSGIQFPRPPSFNEADVTDKPAKLRFPLLNSTHIDCLDELFHARLETMRAVDDLAGELVTALKNNNELWKTVIIFTSDNGFMLGEHRMHGKTRAYEESIGVPLYMRIPKVAPQTIDKLVINNDLTPTFVQFANAQPGIEVDGRSIIPLIENPNGSWRNGFLIETPKYTGIRTDDYVYVYHKSGAREIYDLDNDPYELKNVKSKSPWSSKITALEEWRLSLAGCAGASCRSAENRVAP